MKSKYVLLFLGLFLLIPLFFVGAQLVKTDYEANIPQERPCPFEAKFQLNHYLTRVDASNISQKFPYKAYLDSANWCNIQTITSDLELMDKTNGDTELNRDVMAQALTETLELRLQKSLQDFNPDSLIFLLQWAGRFNNYQELDEKNAQLYRRVHRYWFNLVSNKMGQYAEQHSSLKYNFKFKYIVASCHSKMFSPPIGYSGSEKIINNLIEQNFAYLFNRFWYSTGIVYKLVALVIITFCFYALWCIYKVHFGRI